MLGMREPVGVAWYTPETYARLMQVADDRDQLYPYHEWVTVTLRVAKEIGATQKVVVDLNELRGWCARAGRPNNSEARSIYVTELLKQGRGEPL